MLWIFKSFWPLYHCASKLSLIKQSELVENVYITVTESGKTFVTLCVILAPYTWLVVFIAPVVGWLLNDRLETKWIWSWSKWGTVAEKNHQKAQWIAGGPTFSQTEYIWNTSLQGYQYIILLLVNKRKEYCLA